MSLLRNGLLVGLVLFVRLSDAQGHGGHGGGGHSSGHVGVMMQGGPVGHHSGGSSGFAGGGSGFYGGGSGFSTGGFGPRFGGGLGYGYSSFGYAGTYFSPFPIFAVGPAFVPFAPSIVPQVAFAPEPFIPPMPPAGMMNGLGQQAPARRATSNPTRSKELVTLGDRSFRSGNSRKAEERYQLAVKADPNSPIPHVHLAQIAMIRGEYKVAADRLRKAVALGAGNGNAWLLNAPDVQAIFVEPGDFAKQIARIETHLQAEPGDRDAWFLLGAECYLSGRTQQAADVFRRLSDRRADQALAAFLDASTPK